MKKLSILFNFTIIPIFIFIFSFIYNIFYSFINISILLLYGIFLLCGKFLDKVFKFNYDLCCKIKMCLFIIGLLLVFLLPLLFNLKSDILVIGYSLWPLVLIMIVGVILNYLELMKK